MVRVLTQWYRSILPLCRNPNKQLRALGETRSAFYRNTIRLTPTCLRRSHLPSICIHIARHYTLFFNLLYYNPILNFVSSAISPYHPLLPSVLSQPYNVSIVYRHKAARSIFGEFYARIHVNAAIQVPGNYVNPWEVLHFLIWYCKQAQN